MGTGVDDQKLLREPAPEDFQRLVAAAFADPDVDEPIRRDHVNRRQLEDALSDKEVAQRINEATNEKLAALKTQTATLRDALATRPPGRTGVAYVVHALFVSLIVWLVAAVVFAIVLGIVKGWQRPLIAIEEHLVTTLVAAAGFSLVTGLWLLTNRGYKKRRESHEAQVATPRRKAAESDARTAWASWEEAFVAATLRELREAIGRLSQADHSLTLPKLRAVGLGEVFDESFEIQTEAKSHIGRLLQGMRGGSIGISGPRGAGKSTLVRYFCGGGLKLMRNRRVLPLLVTAPVGYEAREFLLHLFATFCRRVLEAKGVTEHDTSRMRPLGDVARRVSAFAAGLAAALGGSLVAFALILAGFRSSVPKPKDGEAPSFGSALLGDSAPVSFLVWGGVMLLAAFAFFVWRSVRDDSVEARRDADRAREIDEKRRELEREDALGRSALHWLSRIRFQQSFSSGWSGSLAMPLGISGGLTTAESLAQNQLSLPEIVASFREIVGNATKEFEVLIGIDELDKLESDEKAFQFLNDIKAIFGIDHAFYLLSVSENAMSNFERRGIPFRDAFDSAFDAIVHVEYLGVEETSRLLQRRVVGLPLPFHYLCHSLSGGLPRDLIRVARDVFYTVERLGDNPPIDAVANELVRKELRAKASAISIAARRLPLVEPVSRFQTLLREVEQVQHPNMNIVHLTALANAMTLFARETAKEIVDDDLRAYRDSLVALAFEIAAFVSCQAITCATFAVADPTTLAAEATGLAELRQALGIYPRYAHELAGKHPRLMATQISA